MEITYGKCPFTNKQDKILIGNNPLVSPIGLTYLKERVDFKDLEQVEFMCRTFNFAFSPEDWIKALQITPQTPLETYISKYLIKFGPEATDKEFKINTKNMWKEVNELWNKAMTHSEILERIKPIKDDFIKLSTVKWGEDFTFIEYMRMEDQFTTTVSTFDVSNPMQIDAIKKAAITSILIDRKMKSGDVKDIKDLTAALSTFNKIAKIDEMIESQQSDVMRTVADLADYLEKSGFNPTYYDDFDRDQVDRTIRDMKEYLQRLVYDSTGLQPVLENITRKYQQDLKADGFDKNAAEVSLEDLMKSTKEQMAEETDKDLEEDDYNEFTFDEEEF